MNARRREFFRPLVECLEPRRLLACDVTFENGRLSIVGDASDNRIAVLATQQAFHVTCDGLSAGPYVEVRSVFIDLAGGDDTLLFDAEIAVTELSVVVYAGRGDDAVDVRMTTLPKVLHVFAGPGDDDVVIVFDDSSNNPVPPPDPSRSAPEIVVDVGAGVDSLVLDVFGSLGLPPSDLGEIGVSVTLTEVLASIHITGVGLLSLVTLFPLGAMEMSQAIRDDRAGRTKTEVAIEIDGPNLAVELATGATADSIVIDLLPQPGSKVDLKLATGRGDDRLDVRSRSAGGDIDWSLDALPGSGDDQVLVAFEHGDIDQPVIIGTIWKSSDSPPSSSGGSGRLRMQAETSTQESHFDLAYDLTGSAAHDVAALDLNLPGVSGFARFNLDIAADLGRGNDDFTVAGSSGPRLNPGTWILDATFRVDAGAGHDLVKVAVAPGGSDSSQKVQIDTGDGADAVTVLLRRLANPHLPPGSPRPTDLVDLDVSTGAGNDQIDVQLESDAAVVLQKVRIESGAGNDRVNVNLPAVQTDGLADLIVSTGPGAGPHVKVFDGRTQAEAQSFDAYGEGFSGGVRVATGDVNGDGVPDIITAPGPGGGPHVKVFDGRTHAELSSFFAYGPNFAGGVFVASGDVNGDGRDDIITGTDGDQQTVGGHVKVFDGRSGAEIRSFFAFPGFSGGVRVAAGDVTGDGTPDIIVAAGPGAGPHVKVFDGRSHAELASFFAYGQGFTGGVFVAAGDLDGDGLSDIITGADAGAPGGHVKVFSGATGAEIRSFFAFDPNFTGGVRVAAGDVNGDGFVDIITGAGPGAPGGHVKVFDGRTHSQLRSFLAFDPNFTGGVYVGAGDISGAALSRRLDLDLAINTGHGHDLVNIHQSAAADEVQQKVRVETGQGNDVVGVHYVPSRLILAENGAYDIDAGGGDDLVTAHFQVTGEGMQSVRIDGGTGRDRLSADFRGAILDRSAVDFVLRGGAGHDQVRVRFDLWPGSPGQLSAQVLGETGDDELGLAVLNADDLDLLFALLDGGPGRDRARATPNVLVKNVP